MDFHTLEKNVRSGLCSDLNSFELCVNRIVDNAMTYNKDTTHPVYIEAKVLKEAAGPVIESIRWKFNKKGYGGQAKVEEASNPPKAKREKKRVSYDESDSKFWDAMGEKKSPGAVVRRKNAQIAGGAPDETFQLPPSVRQYRYSSRDADIPGAAVPQCKKDLKGSTVNFVSERKKWLGWVEDMVTVCNEAARRRTLVTTSGKAQRYDKPLSDDYIKERLELDDPLVGFTVRDKSSSSLQGFIVTTNFTVWRDSFRWDTAAPQAGITSKDRREKQCDDGSLSEELGKVKRSGDKKGSGIVYERVAEIGLLGGLGCGANLVTRAVQHLEDSNDYDYLVLQATKMAIPFYERCGFIRVGAIAKFNDNPNMPYVSYRHWSDIVAGTAVEASYMMGMRLGTKREEYEKKKQKKKQKEEKVTPKTEKRREMEREEKDKENAISVARSLILQAINTSVDEDGGGSAFKELVALAKESASEAKDLAMVKALEKVQSMFKSSILETVLSSKDLLRTTIGLDIASFSRTKEFNVVVSLGDEVLNDKPDMKALLGDLKNGGGISVSSNSDAANITKDLDMEAESDSGALTPREAFVPKGNALVAKVPSNTMIFGMPPIETLRLPGLVHRREDESTAWKEGPFLRDLRVRVNVEGKEVTARREVSSPRKPKKGSSPADKTKSYRLRLGGPEEKISKNSVLLKGRIVTSLDNLPLKLAATVAVTSVVEMPPIVSGDAIMYRFESFVGWLEGIVERACKKTEQPIGSRGRSDNYVVKFSDGRRMSVMLSDEDGSRGVGRTWCRAEEWAGFPVLPLDLLDACMRGQEVEFNSMVGAQRCGTVVGRVGGGLAKPLKWIVELDLTPEEDKTRKTDPNMILTQEFTTAQMRNLVKIDDLGYARMRSVLESKYEGIELSEAQRATFGFIDGDDEEDRKARRRRLREESEDRIVVEVNTHFYLYGRERTAEDRLASLKKMKEREKGGGALEGKLPPNVGATATSKRPRSMVEDDEEDTSMEEDHVVKQTPSKKKAKVGEYGNAKGVPSKSAKKSKPNGKAQLNGKTPVKVESPKKARAESPKKAKAESPKKARAESPKKERAGSPKKPATPQKKNSSSPKSGLHKKKATNGGKVDSSSKKSRLESQAGKRKGGVDSGGSAKKRLKEELAGLAEDAVSNYNGVYRENGRYAAQVVHQGKLVHLGLYDKAVAAARAYDEGLKKFKVNGEPNFQPVKERAKRGSV